MSLVCGHCCVGGARPLVPIPYLPSPYATPTKQSLVSSEDIAMVVGLQARDNNSSNSKAVSDSSLNNILDSSGLPVRNILRRPTVLADEVSPADRHAPVGVASATTRFVGCRLWGRWRECTCPLHLFLAAHLGLHRGETLSLRG